MYPTPQFDFVIMRWLVVNHNTNGPKNFKKLFKADGRGEEADEESLSPLSSCMNINAISSSTSSDQSPKKTNASFTFNGPNSLYPDLPSRYRLFNILGEGAFSTVYEAKDLQHKSHVAVKVISKENLSVRQLANVKNEINVMKKANNHENVLKLLDHYDTEKHCFLILEYCDGGEIFNKIIEYTYFSENLSRHVFRQLLSAIDYLHNQAHVVHRDIKPENLIIKRIKYFERSREEFLASKRASDDDSKIDEGKFIPGIGGGTIGIIKLADFGLAKQLKSESSNFDSALKTPCGTAGYTAPEVITCNDRSNDRTRFFSATSKKNNYSKAVDIWSLGCLLYTVLCGFPPFYDDDPENLTAKIIKGQYLFLKPWWDDISDDAKNLIDRMLDVNPESRISIKEIWQHPWVKNVTFDQEVDIDTTCDNYFSSNDTKFNDSYSESLKDSVEHIEYSEDHLSVAKTICGTSPLFSPRANAIRMVFNNRAMAHAGSSILNQSTHSKSSVQFIENISETNNSSDETDSCLKRDLYKNHPRTPNPTLDDLNDLNFKDVFKVDKIIESVHKSEDDHSDNEYEDDDVGSGEDDLASLDNDFTKRRDSSQKSPISLDSDEEASDYRTRSSSIISGIAGDFKFTLNLNDSNLLTRRRSSTLKSLSKINSGTSSLRQRTVDPTA
ncbi:uncharacterized protein PRCAT00001567001 [Priceomyces carsonii]|uniref:uncharacterized protein n=1 Tax=Priceomyces carsonii TaxID=28549 RepID=UPI002ED953C5|nr:unnamed protein product [Priceomyces carsonii]